MRIRCAARYWGSFHRALIADLFSRLVDPVNMQEINLQRDSSGKTQTNFGADFAVAYLFAILLMLAVFTTNGYMMQTVIEEKETRLIEILISSMRPTQLLAGKIFALGLLGFLQIVVWLVAIVWLGRLAAGSGITALVALISLNLSPMQVLIFLALFRLRLSVFCCSLWYGRRNLSLDAGRSPICRIFYATCCHPTLFHQPIHHLT